MFKATTNTNKMISKYHANVHTNNLRASVFLVGLSMMCIFPIAICASAKLVTKEGLGSLYRGLTPELLKVIPMVGTMFTVYEWSKELLDVKHNR